VSLKSAFFSDAVCSKTYDFVDLKSAIEFVAIASTYLNSAIS